jgi:hypothetical protein
MSMGCAVYETIEQAEERLKADAAKASAVAEHQALAQETLALAPRCIALFSHRDVTKITMRRGDLDDLIEESSDAVSLSWYGPLSGAVRALAGLSR